MEKSMTISERQQNIFALIGKHPDITVRELAETFFVSEPTIRRLREAMGKPHPEIQTRPQSRRSKSATSAGGR